MLLTESHRVQGPGEHASMDLAYPLAVGETEFQNIPDMDGVDPQRGRMQKRDVLKNEDMLFLSWRICCVRIVDGALLCCDWWWARDLPRLVFLNVS